MLTSTLPQILTILLETLRAGSTIYKNFGILALLLVLLLINCGDDGVKQPSNFTSHFNNDLQNIQHLKSDLKECRERKLRLLNNPFQQSLPQDASQWSRSRQPSARRQNRKHQSNSTHQVNWKKKSTRPNCGTRN